jgi:hypothetical protein
LIIIARQPDYDFPSDYVPGRNHQGENPAFPYSGKIN